MDIQNSPRRWWVLAALAVSLLTFGLDTTILNVALPTLATDLSSSTSQLQWFSNSYTLALAAVLLPAGALGDRYGPKALLMGGLALFGAASAWCALSGSGGELIAARAVLGIGAAFMIPLSSAILMTVFAPAERGRAIAVWATSMSLGIPLGPIVGGLLLQHFAWGSVFWVNVPLAVIGVVALGVLVPHVPGRGSGRLDLVGLVLAALGLSVLTYGLVQVGSRGWTDAAALVEISGGLLVLAVFLLVQRGTKEPLVDLGLSRSAGFTWGTILATLSSFGLMGVMFVLPQFFSAVGGADALGSGLRLLPLIAGLMVGVQIADRVRPRAGATVVVTIGFAVMTLGLAGGALTSAGAGFSYVGGWSGLAGIGLGFAMPASMDLALGALAPGRAAAGSALSQSLRQVGGTLGVAVLGSVLNAGYRARVDRLGLPGDLAHRVRESGEAGVAAVAAQPDLLEPVRAAFTHGMDLMLLCAAAVTAVAGVLAARFLPRQADDVRPEVPEETPVDATMGV